MANLSIGMRLHEKLADIFPWVQYPNVSGPTPTFFKNALPFHKRFLLVLAGGVGLLFSVIALFFIGLIFWAIIAS